MIDRAEARRMVACLDEDVPYRAAADAFVTACCSASDAPLGQVVRCLACYDVFHATEQLLAGDADPVPPFIALLDRTRTLLDAAGARVAYTTTPPPAEYSSVEHETGSHYGNLFRAFDAQHYYDEPFALVRTRLERNGFETTGLATQRALDAGCGGGRYTVALRRLGFGTVVGLDTSEEGIASARERLAATSFDGVSFERGSVLELPYPDASFDFVFSNGVLHHTRDMERGVAEMMRVLKPGGRGFLYVIESPGGIFWDVIELLRVLMKGIPYELARSQFALLGVPPNRRFYILDHIMVPINIRSTPSEVERLLAAHGATNIRRLERGTDFDRVERIFQGVPHARAKYGVGENRYLFARA